jgi:hypothetical protein
MPSAHLARSLAATAACLIGGCGGGDAGGPGADRLETLLSVQAAQALLTDTGVPKPPPDSPRVKEAAEEIDVDCDSRGGHEYECAMDFGGDFETHCAMETNAAITRVVWQECGADHPPEVTSEYVECDGIGDVASAEDVIDRQEPLTPEPTGDLKQVRVATSPDRLCVEWQAAAPVEVPLSVHFWAYPPSGGERLALTGSLEGGQPPQVSAGPYGSRDGTLGVRGDSVSLVVERDDLPETQRAVLDGPFTFLALGFGDDLNQRRGDQPPSYP